MQKVTTVVAPVAGRGRAVLPVRYQRWQDALTEAFFARDHAPVMLFVDDDELDRLVPDSAAPAAELAEVVAELVDCRLGRSMFAAVARLANRWQRGSRDGPPPTLPLLALTVLAATRMRRDTQGASHNYYLRLAQVMRPESRQCDVDAVTKELRIGAFLAVVTMWQQLDRWLGEQGGKWGISTIRDHPDRTRIGYPQSQAVLRSSDRSALTRFFAALKIKQRGVPDSEALYEYLKIWASRPRGLSDTLRRACTDDELKPFLQPLVDGLAHAWDGSVITPEGLRRLDVRLVLDPGRWNAVWAIPVAEGADEDVLTGDVAGEAVRVTVIRDPYSRIYQAMGLPPVSNDALRNGFRLRGSLCAAEFVPSPLLVFRENPDAGGWMSAESTTPFEEHLALASAELATEVRTVLAKAADDGWRHVVQRGRPLVPGYAMFTGVVFSDQGRLHDALRTLPGNQGAAMRPDLTARPRLAGGLPLAQNVSRDTYLTGGEPDLLLPAGPEPRHVDAALDGFTQEPRFLAQGFPIPLRRAGPLQPGPHQLDVDLETLNFTLLEASPVAGTVPGTGDVCWDPGGTLTAVTGAQAACGADIPGEDGPDPVVARRGYDETWMLHSDGRCEQIGEPDPPEMLTVHARGFTAYYFEVTPAADTAWLAQRKGARWRVSRIQPCEPAFADTDRDSLAKWAEILLHGPRGDALWLAYQQDWERARGR